MPTTNPGNSHNRYLRFAELEAVLQARVESHPQLLRIESLGKSREGRDLWVITATDFSTGPAEHKPALWIDGNIHATEVSGSTACLHFLDRIVEGFGTDEAITHALRTRTFYVAPRLSPDGAERFLSDSPKLLRSNVHPFPYDEEPVEGYTVEDINGDGKILQMRIPDANGGWKAHPKEPRLLIRRQPDDYGGTYYRILPEGRVRGFDGVTLHPAKVRERLDLNRNFPTEWRPHPEQEGAGRFPTSEPEVRAMVEFITRHRNIGAGVSFHTFSGVLLRPPSTKAEDSLPAEDLRIYRMMGEKGTTLTGYPAIPTYPDFQYSPDEVITGTFDWLYEIEGAFCWTVEIWSPQRAAGIPEVNPIAWFREHPPEDDLALLRWSDRELAGQGYETWRSYDHPELGPVEIGGWNFPLAFRNPPPHLLAEEVARFPAWLVWQARLLPVLEEHSHRVTDLGNHTWQIEWVVQNGGHLPTDVSALARKRNLVRGVVAEIEIPLGAILLQGKPREEFGQWAGRSHLHASSWGPFGNPTEDRRKLTWIVRLPDQSKTELPCRVFHERAGRLQRTFTLGSA